jgi:hypothetical protein
MKRKKRKLAFETAGTGDFMTIDYRRLLKDTIRAMIYVGGNGPCLPFSQCDANYEPLYEHSDEEKQLFLDLAAEVIAEEESLGRHDMSEERKWLSDPVAYEEEAAERDQQEDERHRQYMAMAEQIIAKFDPNLKWH